MLPDPRKTVRAAELRYLNQPQPIHVEDEEGVPRAVGVTGNCKLQIANIKLQIGPNPEPRMPNTACRVRRVRDHWRVEEGWWREPICRFYYELEMEDGRVVIVYRDSSDGSWYEQRYGVRQRR